MTESVKPFPLERVAEILEGMGPQYQEHAQRMNDAIFWANAWAKDCTKLAKRERSETPAIAWYGGGDDSEYAKVSSRNPHTIYLHIKNVMCSPGELLGTVARETKRSFDLTWGADGQSPEEFAAKARHTVGGW